MGLSTPKDEWTAYVVVLAGGPVGHLIYLQEGQVTRVGRSPECELRFSGTNISREHATFENQDGQVDLVDLGSTNGTLVNGKRITRCRLFDKDRICIGDTILRFAERAEPLLKGQLAQDAFLRKFREYFVFHRERDLPLSLMLVAWGDAKRIEQVHGLEMKRRIGLSFSKELADRLWTDDVMTAFSATNFAVLSTLSHPESAEKRARLLFRSLTELKFRSEQGPLGLNVIIGLVSSLTGRFRDPEEMLLAADQNLAIGRKKGMSQIIF